LRAINRCKVRKALKHLRWKYVDVVDLGFGLMYDPNPRRCTRDWTRRAIRRIRGQHVKIADVKWGV
jgi:hypothetical protein